MKRRPLSLLSIGHLVVDVTAGAVPAALPFLQHEFGLSYLMVAFVATTYQVTSSIAQPIFGTYSDAGARRYLIPLGVLLSACGFAALGNAPSYALMLVAIAVTGIGSAIFHPEATKSARFVSGPMRATGMSFFTIGGNIGVALGPLVFTLLVDWGGLHATAAYAIAGIIAALGVAIIGPSISRAETAQAAGPRPTSADSDKRAMAMLVVVVATRSIIYSGILVFVPLYAVNVLHHAPSQNGPLLFAILAAGAIATIAGAAIGDRVGNKQTMTISFAFVPPLLALYLVSPGPIGIVALVLVGAFLIGTTTITVVMAHEFMPHRIALASALVIGFTSGIGGVAIAGLGHVADVAGLPVVLWSLVGVSVVGTALTMLMPASSRHRAPEDAVVGARNLAASVVEHR
ncbi:MAG TPA: MFS transporter [Candidatus Eremiobacteraceae bacterium]|nr:MFS transporter [Candidatus Eremiobacteraceae bacterium]